MLVAISPLIAEGTSVKFMPSCEEFQRFMGPTVPHFEQILCFSEVQQIPDNTIIIVPQMGQALFFPPLYSLRWNDNIIKLQLLISSSQRSPNDSTLQTACRLGDGEVKVKRAGGWEGREGRGSPDTLFSQERTSKAAVTVMGCGHNEDTSLQQWGALSQAHTPTGRCALVDSKCVPTPPMAHTDFKPLSWSQASILL